MGFFAEFSHVDKGTATISEDGTLMDIPNHKPGIFNVSSLMVRSPMDNTMVLPSIYGKLLLRLGCSEEMSNTTTDISLFLKNNVPISCFKHVRYRMRHWNPPAPVPMIAILCDGV
jgi:hypothetical protein